MPQQKRWICLDCAKEWCYRHEGPVEVCICGSDRTEQIEYLGLFDSQTNPADIAALMAGAAELEVNPVTNAQVEALRIDGRPPSVLGNLS